jgi:hypothetical protein
MPLWGRYMLATFAYGGISAVPQTWRAKRKYTNGDTYKTEILPVPIVEKFGIALSKMCVAPVWWPFMMYNDLTRLELHYKNVDPRKYGFDPDRDIF